MGIRGLFPGYIWVEAPGSGEVYESAINLRLYGDTAPGIKEDFKCYPGNITANASEPI